jgi:hypothetical protein
MAAAARAGEQRELSLDQDNFPVLKARAGVLKVFDEAIAPKYDRALVFAGHPMIVRSSCSGPTASCSGRKDDQHAPCGSTDEADHPGLQPPRLSVGHYEGTTALIVETIFLFDIGFDDYNSIPPRLSRKSPSATGRKTARRSSR